MTQTERNFINNPQPVRVEPAEPPTLHEITILEGPLDEYSARLDTRKHATQTEDSGAVHTLRSEIGLDAMPIFEYAESDSAKYYAIGAILTNALPVANRGSLEHSIKKLVGINPNIVDKRETKRPHVYMVSVEQGDVLAYYSDGIDNNSEDGDNIVLDMAVALQTSGEADSAMLPQAINDDISVVFQHF